MTSLLTSHHRILKESFMACLHRGGGPQVGEVTCGGSPHLSCKCIQIKNHYETSYGQAGNLTYVGSPTSM